MMAISMLSMVIYTKKVAKKKKAKIISVSNESVSEFSISEPNSPRESRYWLKIASMNQFPKCGLTNVESSSKVRPMLIILIGIPNISNAIRNRIMKEKMFATVR